MRKLVRKRLFRVPLDSTACTIRRMTMVNDSFIGFVISKKMVISLTSFPVRKYTRIRGYSQMV
jgi:hypothetical protein